MYMPGADKREEIELSRIIQKHTRGKNPECLTKSPVERVKKKKENHETLPYSNPNSLSQN